MMMTEPRTVERSVSGRTVAVLTVIALVLGTWLPLLSGAGSTSVADGGSTLIVYVLITAALLLIGAFGQFRSAPLLAAGAATAAGGIMLFLIGISWSLVSSANESFGSSTGPGGGLICMTAFCALALTLLITAIRGTGHGNPANNIPGGGYTTLGVLSAAAITLGAMLPTGNGGVTFAQQNFKWTPWYVEVSWLTAVGSLGIAGVIGFASRRRWGMALAFGAIGPTAWLVISSATDKTGGDTVTTLFDKIHPVMLIGMITYAISLLWMRSAATGPTFAPALTLGTPGSTPTTIATIPAAAHLAPINTPPRAPTDPTFASTVTSPDMSPDVIAPPAATPPVANVSPASVIGRWDTDPYGRHEFRYYDGRRWTANVSNQGTQSSDPPGPTKPSPQWATDPYGRHELRYHDGRRWTTHVSNNGVVTADQPGYTAPPPPTIQ